MPWGSPVFGSQLTTIRRGAANPDLPSVGKRVSVTTAPNIEIILSYPFTRDLLELSPNNTIAAIGTSPDFSVLPKWRKVVRTIG